MAIDSTPLNDFFSNIKDKLTNPFFGTLIIVWLTQNWELVYSIFNFDNDLKLADKIMYIESYFSEKSFLSDLGICVLLALAFMTTGYLVILLTRSISIFVEHNAMPAITKRIINKNTVLKEEFDKVASERDNYFKKYEDERKSVRILSDDYDNLQGNYKSLSKNYQNLTNEHKKASDDIENHIQKYDKLNNENKIVKNRIEVLKSETNQLNSLINSKNIDIINSELSPALWSQIINIFRLPPDFLSNLTLSKQEDGKLLFDRKHFEMKHDRPFIQRIILILQQENLGTISENGINSIEFMLNKEGQKFFNLIKVLKEFKKKMLF